jgi:demethylmenaquinone methyltransferase/2-methoxy-6-polyprenyl-1,4-benzoquinol methylase
MSLGPSREKAAEMFDTISPTYDFLNTLLSCGIDRYWRWQTARHLIPLHTAILDVATGTGDQLLSLAKRAKSPIKAIGIDPSPGMLKIAGQNMQHIPWECISFY